MHHYSFIAGQHHQQRQKQTPLLQTRGFLTPQDYTAAVHWPLHKVFTDKPFISKSPPLSHIKPITSCQSFNLFICIYSSYPTTSYHLISPLFYFKVLNFIAPQVHPWPGLGAAPLAGVPPPPCRSPKLTGRDGCSPLSRRCSTNRSSSRENRAFSPH